MSLLVDSTMYMGAAIVAVPICKRLGLGSTLGYLLAGVAIGPSALGLVSDPESILHFAELGVVLLLFIVGLELEPARLSTMRRSVFGMGGLQVLLTGLVFAVAGWAFELSIVQALVVGGALALSSTALGLQTLGEHGESALPHGRMAFSILLFHDMIVIPMLAVIPLLGASAPGDSPMWMGLLRAFGTIAGVILIGRFCIRPFLRLVASARSSEVSTAAALFVVVGTSLLMEKAGLSMALGAFLAGVLLAESEYRHELEANIQPFKGLLLGLFFIAIGMSAKLSLVAENPTVVAGLVAGIVLGKFLVLHLVGRFAGLSAYGRTSLGLTLAHGGVFAFLLFDAAEEAAVLTSATTELLVVVVAITMAFTPLAFAARAPIKRLLPAKKTEELPEEHFDHAPVVIAGFGRFGQIVARLLTLKHIPFTAIDSDPQHLDFVRKFGNVVKYGDASRVEILRAARVGDAQAFVLATDDMETSIAIARTVRHTFPNVEIVARARNRRHVHELMDLGVQTIFRETFESSLDAARATLVAVGLPTHEAYRAARKFREYDETLLKEQASYRHDEAALIANAKQAAESLEKLFDLDRDAPGQAQVRTSINDQGDLSKERSLDHSSGG